MTTKATKTNGKNPPISFSAATAERYAVAEFPLKVGGSDTAVLN
jgi:hypothetical protein